MKYITPSIQTTAFNCPHCHVLTSQRWQKVYCQNFSKKTETPNVFTSDDLHDWSHIDDERRRIEIIELVKRALDGYPFLHGKEVDIFVRAVVNLSASICYECDKISMWLSDRLIYPDPPSGPQANADTPNEIRSDYDEASAILQASPRGAAALMRLCIQKLCMHLGKPGDNLNSDIGALVADGLDSRVQKALDAVRVIGNNAVHPGQIDLQDDRATAESLFRLFNLIVEKTISEPKMVDEVYAKLPPAALAQIEKRDKSKP